MCVCVCVSECCEVQKQPSTPTLTRKEEVRKRKKFIHLRQSHCITEDTGQVCLGTVFCRSVCLANLCLPALRCLQQTVLRHDRIIPNAVQFIVRSKPFIPKIRQRPNVNRRGKRKIRK